MVNQGNAVDGIYLDFQKALDEVPHKKLVSQTVAHGVKGSVPEWIKNWLNDRNQRVENSCFSGWNMKDSDVPHFFWINCQ